MDDKASNSAERRELIYRLPKGRYVLVYGDDDDDVCVFRIGRAQIDRSVSPRDKGITDTRARAERLVDAWDVDGDFRAWKRNRDRQSL